MPQPKPQKLRAVVDGYEVRLRYGRGLRGRFVIEGCRDEAEALGRAAKLADVASALVAAEKGVHAKTLLEKVCAARDAKSFAALLKGVQDVASGKKHVAAPVAGSGITFKQLGEKWTSGELARDYPDHVREKRSVGEDKGRLEKHVYDEIGGVPLASFKLEDAERAMRKVPKDLSAASRRHYAQLIVRILGLAVYPVRAIPVSPIPRGWLPKLGPKKARAFLYPDEDANLLACVDVPLVYRLLYGFLAREGMRRDEALSLTFDDVDLKRGVVTLDVNKTDDPRAWALDPGVVNALVAWKKVAGGKAVFVSKTGEKPADQAKLAETFRAHLQLAKVARPELFKSTDARMRIRVHDLRGTFVTLAFANGKSDTFRRGNPSRDQVNNYRRAARSASELGLGELLPLDEAIPELRVGPKVGQGGRGPGGKETRENSEKASTSEAVRKGGLEPPRELPHWNLNPARLPIPPLSLVHRAHPRPVRAGEGLGRGVLPHPGRVRQGNPPMAALRAPRGAALAARMTG
jgi:integrase